MTPRLRGSLLLDQLSLIEKDHGRAIVNDALAALPCEQREELQAALPFSWLSVPAVTAFKSAVAQELGVELLAFQRQLTRRALGQTINGVWRALLRRFSDATIVKRTPILYSKSFDRGEMALDRLGSGSAHFILTGWPDLPEFDAVGLCAGMEAIYEYAGRTRIVATWDRDPPVVRFDVKWEAASPSPDVPVFTWW